MTRNSRIQNIHIGDTPGVRTVFIGGMIGSEHYYSVVNFNPYYYSRHWSVCTHAPYGRVTHTHRSTSPITEVFWLSALHEKCRPAQSTMYILHYIAHLVDVVNIYFIRLTSVVQLCHLHLHRSISKQKLETWFRVGFVVSRYSLVVLPI